MQQGNQLPMGISDGGIFMARNPARLDHRRGVHLLRQKIRRALTTPATGPQYRRGRIVSRLGDFLRAGHLNLAGNQARRLQAHGGIIRCC